MTSIRTLIILFALLLSGELIAQVPAFSQYWLSQQQTTATAMAHTTYTQVTAHYRKQLLAPALGYKTFGLSGSMPLYYKSSHKLFGTAGISLLHDESGAPGLLRTQGVVGGYTSHIHISSRHQLLGGVQLGYWHRSINWSKVSTDSQYQDGAPVAGADTGEQWSGQGSSVLQVNLGLGWHYTNEQGEQVARISLGAANVNRPKYKSLDNSKPEGTPLHLTVTGAVLALNTPAIAIEPGFILQQEQKHTQVAVGALFSKALAAGGSIAESLVGLSAYYSHQQAFRLSLQLLQPKFLVGIGYDIPAGTAADSRITSALEVHIGWRMQKGQ
ncbi:PorP/SprF family type IX secretion system membrane protein [Cesiribacter sp. SM1]|uniref:PorP/SprF family type IX secretion system membrane protein n=1 Tax=Cesiribacter sp. SM1 TaxID=2861196 RepID=UPI001CD1C958|nr:PorP/SprF family type IX secretion system membrane protein [Cesiribacter sp. SM1]